MADPVFKFAASDDIETLIVMMRDLGRIHLGQRTNDVAAILGAPDCVGGASRKHRWPLIWKYGDIELLFDYRTRQINMDGLGWLTQALP